MFRLTICLLTLALLAGGLVQAAPQQARQPEFIPGQYIVLLTEGAVEPGVAAREFAQAGNVRIGHIYRAALRGFSARMNDAAAQALRRQPGVAAVVPDIRVHATQQDTPTGVNRIDVDLLTSPVQINNTPESPDIDVAVIDTGSGPHQELNVVGGFDATGAGNSNDVHGHGTHVAGTVGAYDDGDGVVGVCPGARIWSVRVLEADGSGALSTVAAGIDWVANTALHPPIEVANMSLAAYWPELYAILFGDAMQGAVANAAAQGVHFAVAAGNDAANAVDYIPARYTDVTCTSAFADSNGAGGAPGPATPYGPDESLATFSNFGSVVDVTAPGVDILSTWPGGYAWASGTSMASPHVAGALAVYLLANPGASPGTVRDVFRNNGEVVAGVAQRLVNLPLLLDTTPPPPTPFDFTVTVATDRASYRRGQTVTITVQATDNNGNPVAGAPVNCVVTAPNGATTSAPGTTDGAGTDVFLLFTSSSDPRGTRMATATVSAGGLSRSGTTTFRLR